MNLPSNVKIAHVIYKLCPFPISNLESELSKSHNYINPSVNPVNTKDVSFNKLKDNTFGFK